MKITKFVHSCLLVEMPPPVNRTALFDPGTMSEAALDVEKLEFLDDIIYTHNHNDHFNLGLLKRLLAAFPNVRITATPELVEQLSAENIQATSKPSEGIVFFESPHESVAPLFSQPQQIGVHYLDIFTDPGDSHSFHETKPVLALPIQAPWGSSIRAINLALELKPKYIVPIHDWHWSDAARLSQYDRYEEVFAERGITFLKPETGKPIVLTV